MAFVTASVDATPPVGVSGVATGQILVAGPTFSQNLGAEDNHIGLDPAERTPRLSFALDAAPAPAPTSAFERTSSTLRSRCMPCHAPGGANAGNFNLGVNDADLFTELTTGTRNCPVPTPYVQPNDADASFIVQTMEGAACSLGRIPLGLPPVPQSLIDEVRAWIDEGASQVD